ncbi:MAG: hypothetical protein EKK62_04100 [Acidimicrobiia bacterium]|nr:MAG: hypothetical protein EKK62_04100 [Acidimicrobiia bacterium]
MTNAVDTMKAEAAEILAEVKAGNSSRVARRFALLREIAKLTPKSEEPSYLFRGSYDDAVAHFGGPVRTIGPRLVGGTATWTKR